MKNLKIAAVLMVSAALFVGCDVIEKAGSGPSVSITALIDTFDAQGEAVVQVALSSYALEDVTAVLSASGDVASAVTMEKAVKIPIGSKTGNVTVKIDLSQVTADSSIKIAITSATGATVGSPSEATIAVKAGAVKEDPAVLSIEADEEFAEDATATVTLKLNKAVKEDVSVELEVLSSEDYVTVDAQALSFQNPVTIAAGQTSAAVKVTLNPELLPTGDNYACIAMKSVTGNATLAKTTEVQILYTKSLTAVEMKDWTITYDGRSQDTDGSVVELITINGWSGDYYDIAVFYASAVGDTPVVTLMQERDANYYKKYIEKYTIDQILMSKTGTVKYNRFAPDSYIAFIFDYDSKGNLTGKYAKLAFEVPQEEATDLYAENIGAYELTVSADSTLVVAMIDNDVNHSYSVYFNTGFFGEFASMDWDAAADSLVFASQYLESYEDSDYGNIDCYFWGCYEEEGKLHPIRGTGYPICTAKKDADGKFVFNASSVTVSSGEVIPLVGFCFYGYITSGEYQGYYLTYNNTDPLRIPFTMKKVGTIEEYFGGNSNEAKAIERKSIMKLKRFHGAFLAGCEYLSVI